MHRRWISLCSVGCKAVAVLVMATALACPVSGAPKLDADGAVRLALSRNHDLQAARAQVQAAVGRLRQAGMWPNPRIELGHETDRPFANEGEYSSSVGLSLDLPISGRLGRAQDVARVDVARALAEVNDAERQLIGDVASAYYQIVAIDQNLKLRGELITSIAELAAVSQNRFSAGEVSELDVNAASLELMRLKQDRTILAGERAAAVRTLAGLIGLNGDEPLALDSKQQSRSPLATSAELVRRALERRPDLRLLDLAANRAEAERALASASAWEDWGVSLGVKRDRLSIEGAPRQPAEDALAMTLTIPFPVLNQNEGIQRAAASDSLAAREQEEALRQRIENEVTGGAEQLAQLAAAVDGYEREALPLARKNTALAHNAYRKGQIAIGDVVQAERQEKEVATNYADALGRYLRARVSLETATVAHLDLMTRPVEVDEAREQ
ncbi:MAG: hypothetical protein GC190_18610 [Alphaproteobacteria bacterium]|nr:hypothetical protein [Alphaproteobacteria bacterium]